MSSRDARRIIQRTLVFLSVYASLGGCKQEQAPSSQPQASSRQQPRSISPDRARLARETAARAAKLHDEYARRFRAPEPDSELIAAGVPPKHPKDPVPENGDLQKLRDGTAEGFGQLAFIKSNLGCTKCKKPGDFISPDGELVADIVIDPGAPPPTYEALHLTTSNAGYCVRLKAKKISGNDYAWKGYVLPSPGACPRRQDLDPKLELNVIVEDKNGSQNEDYPETARWDEGANSTTGVIQPIIEVQCGKAWCDLVPPGVVPNDPVQGPGSGVQDKIKGWYDQQVVTVLTPTNPPKLKRKFPASIIPANDLGAHNKPEDFSAGVQVATVVFGKAADGTSVEQSDNKYARAGFVTGRNGLFLQFMQRLPDGTEVWDAWVEGSKVRMSAAREPHFRKVTATTRWSWSDDDEDVWVRCTNGCCYVDIDALIR